MRWYHGTSKQNAEQILKEGVLKPGEASIYREDVPRYDAVYVTSEWQIAKHYSEERGKDGVVLEVAVNPSKLLPDEDSVYDALHDGAVVLGTKRNAKLGQAIREAWLKHWKSIGGEGNTFEEAWEAWGEVEAEGSSGIAEEMKDLTEEIHRTNPALSKAIIEASAKAAHIGPVKVKGIAKAAKKVEFIKTPGFVIEVPREHRKTFFVRSKAPLEYWAFKNRPRVFRDEKVIFTFDRKPMAEAVVVKVEAPGRGEGEYKHWHKVYWKPTSFKKFRVASDDDDWDDYPNYISGECHQYTLALIELTGYPPYFIAENDEKSEIAGIVHSAVKTPDGKFLDHDGKFSLQQLAKRYGINKPAAMKTSAEGVENMCFPMEGEIEDAKIKAVEQLKKLGIPHKTASLSTESSLNGAWIAPDGREYPLENQEMHGNAALRLGFISPEDVGESGSHQALINAALFEGYVRVVYRPGGNLLQFECWKLDRRTRRLITDVVIENPAKQVLVETIVPKKDNWFASNAEAEEWLQGSMVTAAAAPKVLYHISRRTNRQSILKSGLIPQVKEYKDLERKPGVFFFQSIEAAKDYGFYQAMHVNQALDIWECRIPEGYPVQHDAHPEMNDLDAWVSYEPLTPENLKVADSILVPKSTADAPPRYKSQRTGAATKLYHVSEAKDEQSIRTNGINPSLSKERWNPSDKGFYAFTEYADALSYAMNTVSRQTDSKALIWEVKPTKKTAPDESFFVDGEPVGGEWVDDEGNAFHSSVFHPGAVPKQNVKLVATFDPETGDIDESRMKTATNKKFYHGTKTKNLDDILKNGLKVDKSEAHIEWHHAIYLACDAYTAKNYEGMHGGGEPWTILQIDGSKLNEYYMRPDDYDFPDLWAQQGHEENWALQDWKVSLKVSCQCAYLADIPASAIKVMPRDKTADHYDDQGYWAGEGGGASGVLPVCPSKGTVCLAWRSKFVQTPDCWGTIGGAIQEGMSPQESAKAELKEEMGYAGGMTLIPAFVFTDGEFRYHNFIGVVGNEFKMAPKPYTKEQVAWLKQNGAPRYQFNPGWETDHIVWVKYEDVVKDIQENHGDYHPGLVKLFWQSRKEIEKALGIESQPPQDKQAAFDPSWMKPWVEGKCWEFAIALSHRMPGASFVGLEQRGVVHHVGLYKDGAYYDVRGKMDRDEFNYGADADEPFEIVPMDFDQVMQDGEFGSWIGHEDEFNETSEMKQAYKAVDRAFGSSKQAAEQIEMFPNSQDAKFRQWFDGSKVVDQQGRPMPVYHGTRSSVDFDTFSVDGPPMDEHDETTSSGSGWDPTAFLGAHFAEESRVANQFAQGTGWTKTRYEGENEAPRVIQVFLRITNPKDFGSESNLHQFIYQGKISDDEVLGMGCRSETDYNPWEGDDDPEVAKLIEEYYNKYENDQAFRANQNEFLMQQYRPMDMEDEMLRQAAYDLAMQARHKLEQSGHDGVRYKNEVEGGHAWIAFAPQQIKGVHSQFNPHDQRFNASKQAGGVQEIVADTEFGTAEGYVADTHAEQLENWLGRFNYENPELVAQIQQYGKFAVLNNINVNEDARRQGHGNDLLYEFIEQAELAGADMCLLVADTAEEQAKGFNLIQWYERNDFEEISEVVGGHLMMRIWGTPQKTAAVHTPEYAQQLIVALKQTVHEADFKIIGSVGQGGTSENDLDILVDVHPDAVYADDEPWINTSGLTGAMGLLGFEYLGPSDFNPEDSADKSEASGKYLAPEGSGIEKFFNPTTHHTVEFWFTESGIDKTAGPLRKYVLPTALALGLGAPSLQPGELSREQQQAISQQREAEQAKQRINQVIEAISRAEGAKPELNNPGNLVDFNTGKIKEFDTWEAGRAALEDQLNRIANGDHPYITPDMTLREAGLIYSNGDPNWAKNVSRIMRVPQTIKMEELIKGRGLRAQEGTPSGKSGAWLKAAAGFAFKSFQKLWHVGTMNPKDKRKDSYEGAGLSVSVHPEEWQQIAEIGGDLWELTKPGNRFVNYHRLSKAQRKQIADWGVKNGYAQTTQLWRHSWYDDEMEDWRYSDYATKEEAEGELGMSDQEKVEPVKGGGLLATPKLSQKTLHDRIDPLEVMDLLVTAYAEDALDCDGVWWEDTYDPENLSAPRGVIFPGKLSSWKKKKVQDTGEEEEESPAVEIERLKRDIKKHGDPEGVLTSHLNMLLKKKSAVEWKKVPATDEWINRAKLFLKDKWAERHKELGREGMPTDLKGACKFASMFAQKLFGGRMVGTAEHQVLKLTNRIIDLTDIYDPNTFTHDKEFWMNPEHEESMRSCEPRVQQWVDEFMQKYWTDAYMKSSAKTEVYLYHGTSATEAERIMLNGGMDAGSFWGTERIAKTYAEEAVDAELEYEADATQAIIRVPLSRFNKAALKVDDNSVAEPLTYTLQRKEEDLYAEWEKAKGTWQDSLRIYESVRYDAPLKITKADRLV